MAWAREAECDAYLAIGGGSSIDTAKVANLLACHPEHELDDFVNAPIGRGLRCIRLFHFSDGGNGVDSRPQGAEKMVDPDRREPVAEAF